MNREIKFRAWDKKGERMYYNIQKGIDFDDESHYSFNDFLERRFDDCHEWEIMQFTGLKDKNGKEIYEGDIIRHDTREIYQDDYYISPVWFREGAFKVSRDCFHGEEIKWKEEITLGSYNTDFVKVIGNIYENKELLK